jgi:hypothetical protein
MKPDVQKKIEKMEQDIDGVKHRCTVAREYLEKIAIKSQVFEYLDEKENNTGIAIRFQFFSERWKLVIEVSKMGPFAKRYWLKKTLFHTKYMDEIPGREWKQYWTKVVHLIDRMGVRLLDGNELSESLPEELQYPTPVGPAETVDDLLFFYDGRVL